MTGQSWLHKSCPRKRGIPGFQAHLQVSVPVCFLLHFLLAGSKKLSPQSLSIIFSSATPNCGTMRDKASACDEDLLAYSKLRRQQRRRSCAVWNIPPAIIWLGLNVC